MKFKSLISNSSLIYVFLTFIIKGFSFIKELLSTFYFGTSALSDALVSSMILPNSIANIVGLFIGVIYIPNMLNTLQKNKKKAFEYSNFLVLVVGILTVLLIFLIIYFLKDLTQFLFQTNYLLIERFIPITIISTLFLNLSFIFINYLQLIEKFSYVSYSTLILTFIPTITLIIFSGNIYYYLLSSSIATFCQLIFLVFTSRHFKYELSFSRFYMNEIKLDTNYIYIFTFIMINQLNLFFEVNFANSMGNGNSSAVYYSRRIEFLIINLVSLTVITLVFPKLTKYFALNKSKEFIDLFVSTSTLLISVFTPIILIFIFSSREIISFIFKRGAFNSYSVEITSDYFIWLALSLLFTSLSDLSLKVFYSIRKAKIAIRIYIFTFLVNIILNTLNYYYFHVVTFMSISYFLSISLTLIFLLYKISKEIPRFLRSFNFDYFVLYFYDTFIFLILLIVIRFLKFNIIATLLLEFISMIIYFNFLIFFKKSRQFIFKAFAEIF